jgi:hypothetical protein
MLPRGGGLPCCHTIYASCATTAAIAPCTAAATASNNQNLNAVRARYVSKTVYIESPCSRESEILVVTIRDDRATAGI